MIRKLRNVWAAYVLADLPRDFLKAVRTRQVIVTRFGWDWSRAR